MLNKLLEPIIFSVTKTAGLKTVRHRIKHYSRLDKFKLKTLIRPPNLRSSSLIFPIYVPIRYRHHLEITKKPIVTDSREINWGQLRPNQLLLGFQRIQLLDFKQVVAGLRVLAEVKEQQKHDWNQHQWVKKALDFVNDNFIKIKKNDIMNFYFLMKKLRYTNPEFWKKTYKAIEQNMYDLYPSQFQYIYLTYYDTATTYFSGSSKANLDKLMQGRLRQFSAQGIIQIFSKYIRDKKLDNYWLQNVFISLFKDHRYQYTPQHVAKIFRAMMVLGHQNNQRLYASLYQRVKGFKFGEVEELELLEEVLLEVKEIFISHRVENVLEVLAAKKLEVAELKKQAKKKTIEEMVKEDLKYFLQKRNLKIAQKGKIQGTQ